MEIYCRVDYKKEMVKYMWSTGYVHLHAFIVFSDLEEEGFAVLCFLFSKRTVRFNISLATPMWERKKAIEDWPLPTVHDSGEVGVSCTFSNVPAAGIARSSQLSSSLPGQAVRYVMAGSTARLSQYTSQSWTERRVGLFLYGLWPLWLYQSSV